MPSRPTHPFSEPCRVELYTATGTLTTHTIFNHTRATFMRVPEGIQYHSLCDTFQMSFISKKVSLLPIIIIMIGTGRLYGN